METTLFWVGVGLWGYGWVLRRFVRLERVVQRPPGFMVEHALFFTGVGVLIGSLVHSLLDPQQSLPMVMIAGGVVGGMWGVWQGRQRSRTLLHRQLTLRADLEWIETSASAVLLAACMMYFVVQAFKIPSGSMRETLREGDHLFVNKFIYGVRIPLTERRVWRFRPIRRGQVIVFLCPPPALSPQERARRLKKDFIKRVVALPGDRIEIRGKQLWINGQKVLEPYAHFRDPRVLPMDPGTESPAVYQRAWDEGRLAEHVGLSVRDHFGPVTVPDGCYFVLGDNRDGSYDSRFWGPLPDRYLKGKAWLLYWPITRIKIIR